MKKSKLSFLPLFLVVAIWLGCEKSNHPPVIASLTADPNPVPAGETSTLTVDAYDEDGDRLTYSWSFNKGTLSSPSGENITWTAPNHSGTATISVIVRDRQGGENSDTLSISILRKTTVLINDSDWLPAHHYWYWKLALDSFFLVSGRYGASDLIKFLILDEGNYYKWVKDQPYDAYVDDNFDSGVFCFTVPTTGIYYVVAWNYTDYDRYVTVYLKATSP